MARRVLRIAAVSLLAVSIPLAASATISVSPTTSYDGSYTVSWSDASSGTRRLYLRESLNGGTWSKTLVTGPSSQTFSGKPVGTYSYKLDIYLYDAELRTWELIDTTNVASVLVTTFSPPGAPGPISGPTSSITGGYTLTWGAASGGVDRYELVENGATVYSGTALSATISGKQDGAYSYTARACNSAGCGPSTASFVVTVERSIHVVDDATVRILTPPPQQWVGTIPGTPSTDGGSAGYDIDIEVPPGRGGMQPRIALTYGSQQGNGLAGVGWSLSAGGSIYRCPRTLRQDGAGKPVTFTDADRLCWNGQRLVAANTTYGGLGSQFRTEVDEFARIRLLGGDWNSWSSYFLVEHKSGHVSVYVPLASATQGHPPGAWHLAREFDPQGNCVEFAYSVFNQRGTDEEWVLSSVTYTGSKYYSGASSAPQCGMLSSGDPRVVAFDYTNGRPDKRTTYTYGVAHMMTARLAAIRTSVGSRAIRRYELGYKTSAATGRSLLEKLTVCAGATACGAASLPPTTFAYQEAAPSFTLERFASPDTGHLIARGAEIPITAGWHVWPVGDYDGDGTRDRVVERPDGSWTMFLTSLGRSEGIPLSLDEAGLKDSAFSVDRAVDLDGDGRSDLVGGISHPGGPWTWGYASWRQGWTTTDSGCPIPSPGPAGPGAVENALDYDGNGLPDVHIQVGRDRPSEQYPVTGSDRSEVVYLQTRGAGTALFDCNGFVQTPMIEANEEVKLRSDLNGDGQVNSFLDVRSPYSPGLYQPRITSQSAPGYRFLAQVGGPAGSFRVNPRRRWLDVNGDGLMDIYTPGMIFLNRGGALQGSTFQAVAVADIVPIANDRPDFAFVLDVDGDGADELMVPAERDPGFLFCATVSLNDQMETICGDQFDTTAHAPHSRDRSVFSWNAYRFVEQSDGTYAMTVFATGLKAPTNEATFKAEDFNGDGMKDVAFRISGGTGAWYEGLADPGEDAGPFISLNHRPAPDLLLRATNGLGSSSGWKYKPLSYDGSGDQDPSDDLCPADFYAAHHDAVRSRGYVYFTSSMWAVSRFDADHGLGTTWPPRTTCYRYEDAMLDVEGRGFLGFKRIVAEERLPPTAGEIPGVAGTCSSAAVGCSANNLRTTTEFNQEFPFTNRVKRILVERASDGRVLSETKHWWNGTPGTFTGTTLVYLSAVVKKDHDLASGVLLSRTTSIEDLIDPDSGEAARTCRIADDLSRPASDTRRMTIEQEDRVLEDDTASWWLAKVTSVTKTSDFRSTQFDMESPGVPVGSCPALPNTSSAKLRGARYSWYAATASAGSQRKLESEAIYDGPPPAAAESPPCFPASTSAEVRSCFQYGSSGNLSRKEVRARDVTGALVTAYTHSADGYFLQNEANPAGHTSTTVTDPATGSPTDQQAVQGGPWTRRQYDTLGRLTTTTPDGAKPVETRLLKCGALPQTPAGQVLPPCTGGEVMARAVYQSGAPIRVEYADTVGRVVRTASEGFTGAFVVQSQMTFNARGLKVAEYAPRWDGYQQFETRYTGIDALGRVGQKEVDRSGWLFAMAATDYVHEGYKTRITARRDPAATGGPLEMSRTYDARGKLVETAQRVAGAGSNEAVTQYQYDPTGAVTNVRSGSRKADGTWAVDPTTIDLVAKYDGLGRKTEVRDPDRGTWLYVWDGLGRLRRQTDARGNVTTAEYDGTGRLTARTSTGNGQVVQADWTWDQGQPGVLNRVHSNDGFDRTFAYDALLRPTKVTTALPGLSSSLSVEYAYDNGTGWLKARRYPSASGVGGEVAVLVYDARGFPLGEAELDTNGHSPGRSLRRVSGMDPRGHVLVQQLGNGVIETSDYDASTGMMLNVQATKSSGALIRATAYRYDHFLNLGSQEKTFPPAAPTMVTETFTYDDLHRIQTTTRSWVGVTGETPSTDAYTYDDLGNMRSKSDYATSYGYGTSARATRNAGPHAVAQVTKPGGSIVTFSYDLNGNMLSGDGRTITFDAMDRPTTVCTGGACSAFSYEPDGPRYKQVLTGAVDGKFGPKTVYYVDKDYELTVWSGGTEERTYVGPSVVVYRNGATREVRYQHLDRLGSVDAVTRDDGTELMVDAHGYDPWGKPRGGTWTSSQERLHPNGDRPPAPLDLAQAVATDRGFTGHEHLDAHYLIHMNGRVYDYRLGRFLSVDPIISDPGNPQAVNPYSYIGNNPLSGVDPTGYVGCTKSTGTHTCGFTRMWDVFMSASRDWVGLGAGTGASISSDSGADKQEAKTAKTSTTDAKSPGQTAKQQDGTAGRPADANGASAENARNGATTTASAVAQKLGGVLLAATDDPGTGISRSSAQQVAAEQNAAACAGGEDCTPVYLSAAMSAVLVAGAAAEAAAAAAAEATASVAALRNVRAEYLRKVGELVAKAKGGVESGRSIEEVAREAAAGRNALKLAERAAGPWWAARWADLRNLVRYGNRAGPTADQLFKREGSWERVLQKVGQTDPTYDRLAR